MGSQQKGSNHEREVVNTLRKAGWGAMRGPGSGGGTASAVADVLFGRPDPDNPQYTMLFFGELKRRNDVPRVYIDADEIAALDVLAERWGGTAVVGARFGRSIDTNERVTYFVPTDQVEIAGDNYRVHADDAGERATFVVNATAGEVGPI